MYYQGVSGHILFLTNPVSFSSISLFLANKLCNNLKIDVKFGKVILLTSIILYRFLNVESVSYHLEHLRIPFQYNLDNMSML